MGSPPPICAQASQLITFKDSVLCTDSLARLHPHHSHDHDHEPINLEETLVRGTRRSVSINSVSTQINEAEITANLGKSLAQALQGISGTSMIQTGVNASKPVIQGMHGTRILLLNNGVRQTGQQWGLDHAPELDLQGSQQLQVVKGAETVRYGSEALGGIILLEQLPLPYEQNRMQGQMSLLYGTNGRRYQVATRLEGSLPFAPQWAWRAQASYQNSGDCHTAHYLLNNTGARENNLQAIVGYRSLLWKSELSLSRYEHRYGIMPSAQMGNAQLLAERIRLGQPTLFTPWTRNIDYPHQQVLHHNATLRLAYQTPNHGDWRWTFSYQNDQRTEHRFRRLNRSSIPATALHLYSLQQQLHWRKDFGHWGSEGGLQSLYINNHNTQGTGVVPIIPNYTETTWGFYFLERYRQGRFTAEAGLRWDYQLTKAAGYDWTGKAYGGTRQFSNLSYTLAAHYHFTPQLTGTSNFGLAWRAPHVYELYSNGNELGSGIYVEGNEHLKSERGYKWINSLVYATPHWKVQAEAWLQWIDHYIYDLPTQEVRTVISGSYPLFAYQQTSALFRGLDLDLRYVPFKGFSYHLVGSLLWAHERSTGQYLPYMPPPRFTHELQWKHRLSTTTDTWLSLRHQYVAKQRRFNPSSDLTPTSPPEYHLLGAEIGTRFEWDKKNSLQITLSADNLLNHQYKEYTNRSRYYAHELGRSLRLALTWKF